MPTAPVFQLFFAILVACPGVGWAQTGTAPQQPARTAAKADLPANALPVTLQTATAQPASRTNQSIERIHVEGGTASIDELRVGGETRSITVQPKGGLPAYDVQPATGIRAWKVLGF